MCEISTLPDLLRYVDNDAPCRIDFRLLFPGVLETNLVSAIAAVCGNDGSQPCRFLKDKGGKAATIVPAIVKWKPIRSAP